MDRFEKFQITTVKRNRGFLEIYGHKRPILLEQLESRIIAFQPEIRKKSEILSPTIEFDTIYLALSAATRKYHRCNVIAKRLHNKVVIELIDFGNEFEVDAVCLLELNENDEMSKFLRELPPIATKYFLCHFYCTWRNNEFTVIEQLLRNAKLTITNEQSDREHRYISLDFNGRDLATKLTSDGIGIEISFTEQRLQVQKAFQRAIDLVDEPMHQHRSPIKRESRRNLVPNRPLQSFINNNVIADHGKRLIQGHIAINAQQRLSRSEVSQTDSVSSSSTANQMPAFIANDLPMGAHLFHIVYCSYIEDGPNLFSVQLKKDEHTLERMSFELCNASRKPITTKMMIGMACIALYSEDKSLYRAVIQKVQAHGCRVTFIDYGNSEFVPFCDIFEIPPKFLEHKTFSISFQLAGIKQLQPIDERLNDYFKDVTKETELELKVVPSDNLQIQQCELYIKGKCVLEILQAKQLSSSTFSPAPGLKDGEYVIIRHANTAKQLFLQRSKDTSRFDKMMDALLNYCAKIPPMKTLPVEGKCCAAMHKDDPKEFYRAIVTKKIDDRSVRVRLVDYGADLICGLSQLREMDPKFFELPQQAIECCLIDFENVADVSTTTGEQLDMIIVDNDGNPNQFRVSVRRRIDNGVYLIDLRDDVKDVNVSSSIYKLAMPRKYNSHSNKKDSKEISSAPEKSSNETNVQQTKQQNIARHQEKPVEQTVTNSQRNNGDANRIDIEKASVNNNNRANKRVDGNDNYLESTVADSSGFHSSDVGRTPERVQIIESAIEPVPSCVLIGFNPTLPVQLIPTNSIARVSITSWETPLKFHVQLRSFETDCDEMTLHMEQFYRNRSSVQQRPPVGSLVVVHDKKSQCYQRAKIVEYNEARNKYRVQHIDFGSVGIYHHVDLYELEQSFVRFSAMAICCTLGNVIMNRSKREIFEKAQSQIIQANQSNQIECEFGVTKDEKTQAEICIKGESLRELLIKDQQIVSVPKNFRLGRLIGQIVMLHTMDVTDLTRFQAKLLGCDILFMFSYKDIDLVKKNERLNEEFRSQITANKCVKAKIESIDADNIFHVSIYLPSLDKDVNGSDIIGFPAFKDEFKCEITHYDQPHILYIQNVDNTSVLDKMFEDSSESFLNSNALREAPKIGHLYNGLSVDGNHYRCKIEELRTEKLQALVQWIDYGNCEYIPLLNIRELNKDLKSISALANKVFVPIEATDAKFNQEIFEHVNTKILEETKATIIDTHKSNLIVDINVNGVNMYAELESAKKIRRLNVEELIHLIAQNQSNRPQQYEAPKIIPEKEIHKKFIEQIDAAVTETIRTESIRTEPPHAPAVQEELISDVQQPASDINAYDKLPNAFISHVDHPNQFYLQLDFDSCELDKLQQSLQIVAPQLPPLRNFRRGQLCIANYSYDSQWYRAKIIDSDGETTSIQFIDYGNTDTITNNSLLKSYSDSFNETKPIAMLCSLPVEPSGSVEWNADACQKLRDLMETPVKFELISKDGEINYVKLSVGGRDIVKDLIIGGLAEQLEIINTGETCYTSHINSLDDFFVHVDSDANALGLIEEYLGSASQFAAVDKPINGTICAALFDDGGYYRAQIIDERPKANGIKVVFLDYGNTHRTNELRIINPEISQMPHLRRRCCLKVPDDVQCWNDEALLQFSLLAAGGNTIFTVQLVKPGKHAMVELFVGDENVAQKLGQCCDMKQVIDVIVDDHEQPVEKTPPAEKSLNLDGYGSGRHEGFISHINSPQDFFIQLASKESDINMMVANLQCAHGFEKVPFERANIGSIVAALFDNDSQYYRAKIVNKNENGAVVHFIDYGNQCLSKDLRKLPDFLQTIEPLAVQCRLGEMIQRDLNDSDREQFLNLSVEELDTTFQMEFENATSGMPTVHLYQDGRAIIEYLRRPHPKNATNNQYAAVVDQIVEDAVK